MEHEINLGEPIRHTDDRSKEIQGFMIRRYELPGLPGIDYHHEWDVDREPELFALLYDNTVGLPGIRIIREALKDVKYESNNFLEVYSEIVFIMHLLDAIATKRAQKPKYLPTLRDRAEIVYRQVSISKYRVFSSYERVHNAKLKWEFISLVSIVTSASLLIILAAFLIIGVTILVTMPS